MVHLLRIYQMRIGCNLNGNQFHILDISDRIYLKDEGLSGGFAYC